MTDIYVIEKLTELFQTLNDFSGIKYLTDTNVSYPNKPFKQPSDKRWFNVDFMVNRPYSASLGDFAQDRYTGIMQIDICIPKDKGTAEMYKKFDWLSKLFYRGRFYEGIDIHRCYHSNMTQYDDFCVLPVTIEWEADLDKQ